MEIRINESGGAQEIDSPRLKSCLRGCLLYKEEICSAPRIRFEACRTCFRINPHTAIKNLFEKIKSMASQVIDQISR